MAEKIYLLQDDGILQGMEETGYDSERLLQRLLAEYPDLLAGEQINDAEPRRWLLVSREIGVPDQEGGSDRWSLDHLFLDQDAIPTLVEVKRSTDSRIRREVVGQMLDYAANAVVHWPIDKLRAHFERTVERRGLVPDEVLAEFLEGDGGEGADLDAFWVSVKTNLQAGRIRLVFLADHIPGELRRIVEFLNEQMDPAEVIAVEIRQFVGDGIKTLVPKVIGLSAKAEGKKRRVVTRDRWNPDSFFTALQDAEGPEVANLGRDLLAWTEPLVTRIWWGNGGQMGCWVPVLELGGGRNRGGHNVQLFSVWTYGQLETTFQYLKTKPGFRSDEARHELRRRLNRVAGVDIGADRIASRPTFPLRLLLEGDALAVFKETVEWIIEATGRAFEGEAG